MNVFLATLGVGFLFGAVSGFLWTIGMESEAFYEIRNPSAARVLGRMNERLHHYRVVIAVLLLIIGVFTVIECYQWWQS